MTGHLLTFKDGATATRRLPDHEVLETLGYFVERGGSLSEQLTDTGTARVIVGHGFEGIVILIVEP